MPVGRPRFPVAAVSLMLAFCSSALPGHAQSTGTGKPGSASGSDVRMSFSGFAGGLSLGASATLSVVDAATNRTGISQEFVSQWAGGLRMDGEVGPHWRVALDFSLGSFGSPVTIGGSQAADRRTVSLLETGFALSALVEARQTAFQPYAGGGPAVLITDYNSQGGIDLAFGLRGVAGARIFINRSLYAFAEGRIDLFADRTYRLDYLGRQTGEFPTMVVTLHGAPRAFVFGIGMRVR
jgi:hypothetical protein